MKLPWRPGFSADAAPIEGWSDHQEEATVRILEAAADHLSPDEATLERMFAVSRQAFREARYERSIAIPATHRRPLRRMRLAMALSVALLTLAGTGVVAAAESGPGEPFYRTRLGVESLFLPPAGTPERMMADLDRADARLAEARHAAAAGDRNAEADALGAYDEVVGSMAVPGDEALRLRLRERLNLQLAELEALSAGGSSVAELERAMQRVGRLLEGSGQQATPAPTGQGPNATPSHEPSSSGDGPKASPSGGGPNPSAGPGGPDGGQGSGAGGPNESPGPKAP